MSSERTPEESEASHERWLVSYADFITLLFAFFTVLYATSQKDVDKSKEFQESIKRYLIKAGAFGGSGERLEQGEKYNRVIEPPIDTFPSSNANPAEDKIVDQVETGLEASLTQLEREKFLLDVTADSLGVRVSLSGHELFEDGGFKLSPEGQSVLDKLIATMKATGRRIAVEGHVEDRAYKGLDPWDAAALRAGSVVKYFSRRHQVPPHKLVVISQGSQQKVEEKRSAQAPNERLELVLLMDSADL